MLFAIFARNSKLSVATPESKIFLSAPRTQRPRLCFHFCARAAQARAARPHIDSTPPLPSVTPDYVRNFHCIGPECDDTCCQAWDIGVDKATYERYRLIPAESLLHPIVQSSVVLRPAPRTEKDYAHILINDSLQCPFLSAEKWCRLQKDFGPEYLSSVCATYPRVLNHVDGRSEQSLHLSCPEAARMVLLDQRLLRDAVPGYAQLPALLSQLPPEDTSNPRPFLGAIRAFLIALLQDRAYPLWQRLFLTGLFSNRLQALLAASQANQIPKLLQDYAQIASAGTLRPGLDGIPAQPALQLSVVLKLIDLRMGRVLNSMRFLACTKEFLDGIGYRPNLPIETLLPAYHRAHDDFYRPLMHAHPQLLENYLLNHLFKTVFPYGVREPSGAGQRGPSVEFMALAAHFALIKGLLIGMAGFHRESFSVSHVVRLIQSYGRMIEHHAQFAEQIVAFLQQRVPANPTGIVMLLKN